MAKTKALVTGMSGLIGTAVRRELEDTCELSALNRRPVEGVPCCRADIADLEAIRPAFAGIDVVVHLAAAIRGDWETYLQANVVGTYNVFEAARTAGVKRVVYASSGSVTAGWEEEMPYQALVEGDYEALPDSWEKLSHRTPTRPRALYGCTKVWGEALARHFADSSDMSMICLRIGAVNAEDRPQQNRHFSVWCSQASIARMVKTCVQAPDSLRFDIFYVVSDNKYSYRDLAHSKEVLGYEPEGRAEDHR